MSEHRINRKTYATPRRDSRPLRFLHVSTNYGWMPIDPLNPSGSVQFVKISSGNTYRVSA